MSIKNPFFSKVWKLITSIFGSKPAPVSVPPVVKPVPVPDQQPEAPVVLDPTPIPPIEVPVDPVPDPLPPVNEPEPEVPVIPFPVQTPEPEPLPPAAEIPPIKQPEPAKTEYIKDFTPYPWGLAIKKTTTSVSEAAKQLLLEGDCFVTENGVGMSALNPAEGKFTFGNIDSMLKAVNGKPLFVFHIIWGHASVPDFVLKAKGNRELVLKYFKTYIQTLVKTYTGKIDRFVVVNEAFESNGSLKDCFWLQELGADYIPLAFQFAHEANPTAELLLNDYDLEYGENKKVPAVVAYVKAQVKAGVPIHGIGSQMHTYSGLGSGDSLKNYKSALKALASTGVKIYISELDVAITNTQANIEIQRNTYLQVVKNYTELIPVKQQGGIIMFSLTDDASYKNFDSNGKQYSPLKYLPALMLKGYVRKPVYDDLLNYFKYLKK